MQSTPWDWLDKPNQQRWISVSFEVFGREISYSIPDRLKNGGQHTLSSHPLGDNKSSLVYQIQSEPSQIRTELAVYNWDSWWGGFFKESGVDFWLDLKIVQYDDAKNFLSMTSEQWINWRIADWREFFSNPQMKLDDPDEYFFNNYQIETYRSAKGLSWIWENDPVVQQKFITYMIPISNQHLLHFGFFVNEKRYNWQDDPEWNQRRWDMVHKILDTVRITPEP